MIIDFFTRKPIDMEPLTLFSAMQRAGYTAASFAAALKVSEKRLAKLMENV